MTVSRLRTTTQPFTIPNDEIKKENNGFIGPPIVRSLDSKSSKTDREAAVNDALTIISSSPRGQTRIHEKTSRLNADESSRLQFKIENIIDAPPL